MNVVFLDIDGVMNHRNHFKRSKLHQLQEFCPVAVRCLKFLLERANAYIVLSSTWRGYMTVDELQEEYFKHYGLAEKLVGVTPHLRNEIRGKEIQAYIESVKGTWREVEQFVILDDDADMGELLPRLVQCKDYSGFNRKRLQEALEVMKANEETYHPLHGMMWNDLKGAIPGLTCEGDIIHVSDLWSAIETIEGDGRP